MSKSLKYGEFQFPSSFGFNGSAGKTMVKGYARGGKVEKSEAADEKKEITADLKQDTKTMSSMVNKHESRLHPGEPKTKFACGGKVAARTSKAVPVAPKGALIPPAMCSGGAVKKK